MFGDPDLSLRIHGQTRRVIHVKLVVVARLGLAGATDSANRFSVRVEEFHLMALAVIADIDVVVEFARIP